MPSCSASSTKSFPRAVPAVYHGGNEIPWLTEDAMEEWHNDRSVDQFETPEALLWYSVLESYVTDIRLSWQNEKEPRRSKKVYDLLLAARLEEELCQWLDIDHDWFMKNLEKMAMELGYETRH